MANPVVSRALLAVWPAAIANWVVRLVVETDLFSNVAAAVALKETRAMQHATSLRRLGGARCPPPNAGRARRSWFSLVCLLENVKTMALSGSARIFRRAILACSFVDWALLLGVWATIGLHTQAAPTAAAASMVAATASTSAFNAQPSAAMALPFAAFFALDAVRLASQLLHSRLVENMQARGNRRRARSGGGGDARVNGAATRTADTAGVPASSSIRVRVLGMSMPAGMSTRLTQCLFASNLGNAAVAAALGLTFGGSTLTCVPVAAVNLLVTARFGRLVLESAYLVATLLVTVDRSAFPHPTDAAMPMPAFELAPSFDGARLRGLSSAIGARLDIAGAQMDEFIAGFGLGLPGNDGVNGVNGRGSKEDGVICSADTLLGVEVETRNPKYYIINTLNLKCYILHPTPYVLHFTPYTLHPTSYTLHPKP